MSEEKDVCGYSIVVGNQEYDVCEVDPNGWNQTSMGAVNIIESKILINEKMNSTQKAATLVHEVIHVIADQNATAVAESEQDVTVIANGVYDFIISNPEVVLGMLSLYHDLSEFTPLDENFIFE